MNPAVLKEMLQDLSPEELEEYYQDLLDVVNMEVDEIAQFNPEMAGELMLKQLTKLSSAKLTPEQRQRLLALLNQPGQVSPEDNQKPN